MKAQVFMIGTGSSFWGGKVLENFEILELKRYYLLLFGTKYIKAEVLMVGTGTLILEEKVLRKF